MKQSMIAIVMRVSVIVVLIAACTFIPFLPGRYDGVAVTLSFMMKVFAYVGAVLLMPVGAAWMIYECRRQAARGGSGTRADRSYLFGVAALVALCLVGLAIGLAATVGTGATFGVVVLVAWGYGVARLVPYVRALKPAATEAFNPGPIYLMLAPGAALLFQLTLVRPAIEFSRGLAMSNSAALIADIEEFHRVRGHYPQSLASANTDYSPWVIGVERYHYEPSGEAYNLYFEQAAWPIGTREIVMYNKRDEHTLPSHDNDILAWTPEQLRSRRGYYAVQDAGRPNWKYFWFD